jgi:thioredoxin 1
VSDTIMEVNDGTFASEVEDAEQPVIVDFWAPWCTPCRVMDPILDELAEQHQGRIKFTKVNVDENQGIADRFQVLSIPTLMVFERGEVQKKLIGAVPRRRLEDELSSWLAPAQPA